MRNKKSSSHFVLMIVLILALAAFPASVSANHSWGNYHWARTSNPFTIKVIDSMTSNWDDNLNIAISDWDQSSVMNVVKEAGDDSTRTRKRCRPVSGKVRSCNATYGNNGWLGLAQIWVSGNHITQGTAKMNDSYLASSSYNETNRQHVICQEIGHAWGLGHQDESGADLNTCMDYARALDNPHPNQHDYQQLETIYNSHTDSTTTIASAPPGFANADAHAQENWGEKVHESANGRSAIYVRDFGNGFKIFTFVTWAE
ncbi:MAG TPA: hypothetical protein VFZ43_13875 [Anaerolineales bacterium]